MTRYPATLLLIDEHALFRSAMGSAFDADPAFTLVAEADTVRAGLASLAAFAPDIVLVSTNLPGFTSITGVRHAPFARPVRFVAVSDGRDRRTLRVVIEAGMDGFVTKDMQLQQLVAAVRRVLDGEAFVPPEMLGALLRDLIETNRAAEETLQRYMQLTRREKEVLELLADGYGYDAVAHALGISPQTARTHGQNVINKLGVHSRLEAVALAVEHGLVGGRLALGSSA